MNSEFLFKKPISIALEGWTVLIPELSNTLAVKATPLFGVEPWEEDFLSYNLSSVGNVLRKESFESKCTIKSVDVAKRPAIPV